MNKDQKYLFFNLTKIGNDITALEEIPTILDDNISSI